MIPGPLGVCLLDEHGLVSKASRRSAIGAAAARPSHRTSHEPKHPEAFLCDRRPLGALPAAAMPPAEDSVSAGARALSPRAIAAPLGSAAGTRRLGRQHSQLAVAC